MVVRLFRHVGDSSKQRRPGFRSNSKDPHVPFVGSDESKEAIHGSGLAGAVASQQRKAVALMNGNRKIIERADWFSPPSLAKDHRHARDFNHVWVGLHKILCPAA